MADLQTIALAATIIFCDNGETAKNEICEDSSQAHIQQVYLLTKSEYENNIIEIDLDYKSVFVLGVDGKVRASPDFEVNATALRFWKSLGDNLSNICNVVKK